jgi:hypothetical protein
MKVSEVTKTIPRPMALNLEKVNSLISKLFNSCISSDEFLKKKQVIAETKITDIPIIWNSEKDPIELLENIERTITIEVLRLFALKKIQSMFTRFIVKKTERSLRGLNLKGMKSRIAWFIQINNPCKLPQIRNVHPAPCQIPPRNIVIKILKYRRDTDILFPPRGI